MRPLLNVERAREVRDALYRRLTYADGRETETITNTSAGGLSRIAPGEAFVRQLVTNLSTSRGS